MKGIDMDRVHQRTVSANGAPPLSKPGPSSVFDVAKPKRASKHRVELPPLPDKITIDKAIPIPPPKMRAPSPYPPHLARLTVGASFALPKIHEKALRNAINVERKAGRGTFTVRIVSETDVRVWRTA